jgi:hypothetical protein
VSSNSQNSSRFGDYAAQTLPSMQPSPPQDELQIEQNYQTESEKPSQKQSKIEKKILHYPRLHSTHQFNSFSAKFELIFQNKIKVSKIKPFQKVNSFSKIQFP